MADSAKIFSLAHDSVVVSIEESLKTKYYSVRLIKNTSELAPTKPSYEYSVLLNGQCMDQEKRKLYTFYLDTFYNQAWIFEIDIDTRKQGVVFFGDENQLGFDGKYKIHNAKVVQGTLIWTDNKNPEYQMNILRAKNSFLHGIGYGQYPVVTEWSDTATYQVGMIVWRSRYFYKCLVINSTLDPLAYTTYWEKLCLVEDAYYSTNKKNYYFAPIPPKFGPVPEYFSDSERKPNNLRQTIWQFAYRYVYMDYRKSTFSPACVPDMPDAEEEISTGLANELVELNNGIKLKINTGGEEVRKIEIIGRSTQDPSTWYLIDVIDLFDELEGTAYKTQDVNTEPLLAQLTITIPQPTVINGIITDAENVHLIITVPVPVIENHYLTATNVDMIWDAVDDGAGVQIPTVITVHGGTDAYLVSKPDWLDIIRVADGSPVEIGNATVTGGATIALYPNSENVGVFRTGMVVFQDDSFYANLLNITVAQNISILNPAVTVQVHAEDPSGMTISGDSGVATNASPWIYITFTPDNPLYGNLVDFTMNYVIYKDGINVGTGTFTARNNESNADKLLGMSSVVAPGQTIIVVIWEGTIT
jgi:hypothetical protein